MKRDVVLKRNKKRFNKHRKKIAEVALAYGCHAKREGEGVKLKRIAEEINKCCVLCACCHASVTTKGLIPDEIRCKLLEIQ